MNTPEYTKARLLHELARFGLAFIAATIAVVLGLSWLMISDWRDWRRRGGGSS